MRASPLPAHRHRSQALFILYRRESVAGAGPLEPEDSGELPELGAMLIWMISESVDDASVGVQKVNVEMAAEDKQHGALARLAADRHSAGAAPTSMVVLRATATRPPHPPGPAASLSAAGHDPRPPRPSAPASGAPSARAMFFIVSAPVCCASLGAP
jgi:hypothetical protein